MGFGTLSAQSGRVSAFVHYASKGIVTMNAQSRAELRVRLYSICSWCAELIDRQQGQQPRRRVQAEDLVAHVPQQHALWLEMLGISDDLRGDGS
jgi:hypothetical protein